MKCVPPEDAPFSFDGPEIYSCKGCSIDWKEGKNLTVKTVKKKQKNKKNGNVRTTTKEVKNSSFFNFFNPPQLPDDPEDDVDDVTNETLATDFEIGYYIRERIIPKAVLFFTGEALADEYDEGEEEKEFPDYRPIQPIEENGGQDPKE